MNDVFDYCIQIVKTMNLQHCNAELIVFVYCTRSLCFSVGCAEHLGILTVLIVRPSCVTISRSEGVIKLMCFEHHTVGKCFIYCAQSVSLIKFQHCSVNLIFSIYCIQRLYCFAGCAVQFRSNKINNFKYHNVKSNSYSSRISVESSNRLILWPFNCLIV